ncbi:MAG: hypothetical protein ABI981_03990 [Betaproteobacteria bacterium]
MPSLALSILDQRVRVDCPDAELIEFVRANFGAMIDPDPAGPAGNTPGLRYCIERSAEPTGYLLSPLGRGCVHEIDSADLLYALEKDITLELQRLRADLFFLHASAVAFQGRAVLIAAESGGGKSTTTWGLLHHGFDYLSDELSPVDIGSMQVFPYPHALCLKREPPPGYPLPTDVLNLGRTLHVPAQSLPGATVSGPCPVVAVFVLKYSPQLAVPTVRALGASEASARLYVNALNPLAHPFHGLDAVVRIAETVPCFGVESAGLASTCALIRESLPM